jgi:hypothetical protein
MREFTTAAKAPTEDDIIEVPIRRNPDLDPEYIPDLKVVKARRPSDGQLAVLMASIGKGASDIDGVAGPLNFFDSLLDADGKRYFLDRLLDPDDLFGPEEIEEIMEALVEEWGARPTQPSSGSAPSQPTDGPKSTPTTPQPTSSGSLLTGS